MSNKAKKLEAVSDDTVKQAVATQSSAGLPATNLADWGVPQGLTARDVVIPKILSMQAMSKLVVNGDAKLGEFRDSLNNKLLGMADKEGIEFIPFFMEKVWIVFEDRRAPGAQQPNFKFVKTIPIDASNENCPYEETLNNVLIRRDRTMNFYVLLPKEVEAGTAIPYILSFRRTSARAGQKIATTMFMKNIKAGKSPAAMTLELTGKKTTNDKGTFIVMDVVEKRPTQDAEVAEAFSWVQTVKKGVKVDNSDLEAEAPQYSAGAASGAESTEY